MQSDFGTTNSRGRVLVTGASSFLAKAVARRLSYEGYDITMASRSRPQNPVNHYHYVRNGEFAATMDWSEALNGTTHVVHCAALTRITDTLCDKDFIRVNCDGTRALAADAAAAGVQRFVHISSASIAGRTSDQGPLPVIWTAPHPTAYTASKIRAEEQLNDVASQTGLRHVVIRPPRIVGEELGGNLKLFERLVARGVPLPFGLVTRNRRDNVSLDNLLDIIVIALEHPNAPGRAMYATDGDPLSTRELAERIGQRVGRRTRFLPVPSSLLRLLIRIMPQRLLGNLNRTQMIDELLGNFELDISLARRLGYRPRHRTFETVTEAVDAPVVQLPYQKAA